MSTAEQIIAEALVQWSLEPCCRTCAGGLAAHVVAALTNAGKTIVELPEARDVAERKAWQLPGHGGYVAAALPGSGTVTALKIHMSAKEAMLTGLALLAAARVAEGGERGEV